MRFVSEGHSHVPVEKGKLVTRARRIEGQAGGVVRMAMSEAAIGTVAIAVTALTVLALFSTVGGAPFVTPSG